MPCCLQTKQIVDQTLKTPNPIGGRTGAFAERPAAQGADLMRHKTLLAERSQSAPAGWAPVPKSAAVAKARNACRQAPAPAKIGRFVFRQTGRAELQPGRLRLWCATLLRRCPQRQRNRAKGSGAMVRAAMSSRGMWVGRLPAALTGRHGRPAHGGIEPDRQRASALQRLVVGGPVPGLVGRGCRSAHDLKLPRWILTMNPPQDLCNRVLRIGRQSGVPRI